MHCLMLQRDPERKEVMLDLGKNNSQLAQKSIIIEQTFEIPLQGTLVLKMLPRLDIDMNQQKPSRAY